MSAAIELLCTLSHAEQCARRVNVRTDIIEQVLRVSDLENGLAFEFCFSKKLLEQLEEFISLEQGCCGFLTFAISVEGTALNLLINGPPEAMQVIDMFRKIIDGETV